MIIHIHDSFSLSDIQDRFSKCFPWLKIEFYSHPQSLKKSSKDENRISSEKNVGQVRHDHRQGELEIKSWYSVARVEKDFREKFGLNVQVFRKENGGWVQTSKTDKFTLHEQEKMARHAETSISPKFREQLSEYDEL